MDTCESLLDSDFDIGDEVIMVGTQYTIKYETKVPMMSRTYDALAKAFKRANPPTPPIHINTSFGTTNPHRFIIDFIASQPVGVIYDHTAEKLTAEFEKVWPKSGLRFQITKYQNEFYIYVKYTRVRGSKSAEPIINIILK